MIEKVNPCHPDKVADRIAGAIVDLAYSKSENPKVAVEVLLGHGDCYIIIETSEDIVEPECEAIVARILGEGVNVRCNINKQDPHLASNQEGGIRCGDNGIFAGYPTSSEEACLSNIARDLFKKYPTDGKYILDEGRLIICQSNASANDIRRFYPHAVVNPLGDWTGGYNVDAGATNRKLGSDMGRGVTGGGLHGKDLSKADVSVNIYAFLKAQGLGKPVHLCCAIGDAKVDGRPYSEIVSIAKSYIDNLGGFEKFAEWGLI